METNLSLKQNSRYRTDVFACKRFTSPALHVVWTKSDLDRKEKKRFLEQKLKL